MKKSTKYHIAGFIFFFIGAYLCIDEFGAKTFMMGLLLWNGSMLIDAYLRQVHLEVNMKELKDLSEETIQQMRSIREDQERQKANKVDDKDFIKRSEQ